jgi:hypothetical protein
MIESAATEERLMMRSRRARRWPMLVLLPLLIGTVAACSKPDHVTGPRVQQYTLRAIDGFGLPHEVDRSADGTVVTVVNDMVLSIAEDRTWSLVGHRTVTTNGVASTELVRASGTWSADVSNVTLRDANGDVAWTGSYTSLIYDLFNPAGQRFEFVQ